MLWDKQWQVPLPLEHTAARGAGGSVRSCRCRAVAAQTSVWPLVRFRPAARGVCGARCRRATRQGLPKRPKPEKPFLDPAYKFWGSVTWPLAVKNLSPSAFSMIFRCLRCVGQTQRTPAHTSCSALASSKVLSRGNVAARPRLKCQTNETTAKKKPNPARVNVKNNRSEVHPPHSFRPKRSCGYTPPPPRKSNEATKSSVEELATCSASAQCLSAPGTLHTPRQCCDMDAPCHKPQGPVQPSLHHELVSSKPTTGSPTTTEAPSPQKDRG